MPGKSFFWHLVWTVDEAVLTASSQPMDCGAEALVNVAIQFFLSSFSTLLFQYVDFGWCARALLNPTNQFIALKRDRHHNPQNFYSFV
jgi:hypothetical protein